MLLSATCVSESCGLYYIYRLSAFPSMLCQRILHELGCIHDQHLPQES